MDEGGSYTFDKDGNRVLVHKTSDHGDNSSKVIETVPAPVYNKRKKLQKSQEDLNG